MQKASQKPQLSSDWWRTLRRNNWRHFRGILEYFGEEYPFSKPFNDKQSAFDHEYAYCMNKFQSAIEREESKTQRDSTNFNVPNMRATIKAMKQYVASKKQLSTRCAVET